MQSVGEPLFTQVADPFSQVAVEPYLGMTPMQQPVAVPMMQMYPNLQVRPRIESASRCFCRNGAKRHNRSPVRLSPSTPRTERFAGFLAGC